MRKITGLLFIVSAMMAVSCDSDRVFDDWVHMESAQWIKGDKKLYSFEIKDSLSRYDCWTNLRINNDYTYSNIFLQVEITYPDKHRQQLLLEYTLADENGRWMGKGLGDLFDFHMLHPQLKDLKFPSAGTYTISAKQVMRSGDLAGVMAHGINIIKH